MEKIDPSLVDNKLIFPDDDDARRQTLDFMPLDDRQQIAVRRRLVRCHRWLRAPHGAVPDRAAPRGGSVVRRPAAARA